MVTPAPISLSDVFVGLVKSVLKDTGIDPEQIRPIYESAVINRRRDRNTEGPEFDPDGPYGLVWVSMIDTTVTNGTGALETLSDVEWELRLVTSRGEGPPTLQEKNGQIVARRLYGKWYRHPMSNTEIRGTMLRQNRLDSEFDSGWIWVRRLRFRSTVWGALSAGF